MKHTIALLYKNDHPCTAGHFPGNPIIPGAVILADVAQQCDTLLDRQLKQINKAKFAKPLRPNEEATLELQVDNNSVKFSITLDGQVIASGKGTLS